MSASTWISAIAPALSSFGSVTVAYLTWRKMNQEFQRWRLEKIYLKESDVAAEALVSSLRFIAGLSLAASVFRTAEEPDFERDVRRRWQELDSASNAFIAAWQHAEAYLSERAYELMERVWQESKVIWAAQMTSFAVQPPDNKEFFDNGFGSKVQARLDALKLECRTVFRPIARLKTSEPDRRPASRLSSNESKPATLGLPPPAPPE